MPSARDDLAAGNDPHAKPMAVLHADAVVAPMERDPDLWFGDGSIVVVAQGTGFRVHTSLLSRASPIFRDVFALPRPAADSVNADTVQGAPVIRVSDCAHDMRCMLHAIYDRKYVVLRLRCPRMPI